MAIDHDHHFDLCLVPIASGYTLLPLLDDYFSPWSRAVRKIAQLPRPTWGRLTVLPRGRRHKYKEQIVAYRCSFSSTTTGILKSLIDIYYF